MRQHTSTQAAADLCICITHCHQRLQQVCACVTIDRPQPLTNLHSFGQQIMAETPFHFRLSLSHCLAYCLPWRLLLPLVNAWAWRRLRSRRDLLSILLSSGQRTRWRASHKKLACDTVHFPVPIAYQDGGAPASHASHGVNVTNAAAVWQSGGQTRVHIGAAWTRLNSHSLLIGGRADLGQVSPSRVHPWEAAQTREPSRRDMPGVND